MSALCHKRIENFSYDASYFIVRFVCVHKKECSYQYQKYFNEFVLK